jgi:hypothetical protein
MSKGPWPSPWSSGSGRITEVGGTSSRSDALLDPDRQVLDNVEHVVQLVGRNLLELRELQPVVLDKQHAVLVHAEQEVLRAPLQEHPPHDVANALRGPPS